jgi:hypothetical protein
MKSHVTYNGAKLHIRTMTPFRHMTSAFQGRCSGDQYSVISNGRVILTMNDKQILFRDFKYNNLIESRHQHVIRRALS